LAEGEMKRAPSSLILHTIQALVRKDFVSSLQGWGLYGITFVSFLAASFLLNNYLGSIGEKKMVITTDPLNFPFLISVYSAALYLAIVSAVSISREKDQGTLEVLFYGPVNASSFLWAKYITNMLLYLVLIAFYILYFAAVSGLTHLAFSWGLLKVILLSFFLVSCIISFSLFISSLTSRTRSSLIWLVGVLLVFLAIQLSYGMLLRIGEQALSPPLLFLREALEIISQGTEWISPFSYLNKGMQSIDIRRVQVYAILFSVVYSFIFLFFSVWILERRGVRS